MDSLQAGDVIIEYEVRGNGKPVLLIHPAMIADGLSAPLFAQPELASRYQLIHYHRRGYLGSSMGSEPPTIVNQADDAAALLRHLQVRSAHIVGHSVGALIALQLVVEAPELVFSLALLEPPLFMAPGGKNNLESGVTPMINAFQSGKTQEAVEAFNDRSFGPGWREIVEHTVPGGVEQSMKNANTAMREMMYISEWKFDSQQATQIHVPVLSIVGSLSNPFMKAGRVLLHSWMPQTEDFDPVSTHLLQMQDPAGVAHGLASFFARHPIHLDATANMR